MNYSIQDFHEELKHSKSHYDQLIYREHITKDLKFNSPEEKLFLSLEAMYKDAQEQGLDFNKAFTDALRLK